MKSINVLLRTTLLFSVLSSCSDPAQNSNINNLESETTLKKRHEAVIESFGKMKLRYPITEIDIVTWHNRLGDNEFIFPPEKLASGKSGCRVNDLQDSNGICWPTIIPECQNENEVLRGALSEEGVLDLVCLSSDVSFAQERQSVINTRVNNNCDSPSGFGYVLVGRIKRNADQISIDYLCEKPFDLEEPSSEE